MSEKKYPLYEIELSHYAAGKDFATVNIIKLDSGLTSEWWVSHNLGHDIRLSGTLNIPLIGATLEDGHKRAGFIATEIMEFVSYVGAAGEAGIGGTANSARRAHCRDHLHTQMNALTPGLNATEKTVALYQFAKQFNVSNPAALIAQVEGLDTVRTVHDRLAYARRIGLLNSPGQGRTR